MAQVTERQAISLAAGQRFRSALTSVESLTADYVLRLRLPTTLAPLAWDKASTLRTMLVFVVDGIEHRCTGQVSGGVRVRPDGQESHFYELRYHPTVFVGDKARTYLTTATKDPDGMYSNVPLTRLGEGRVCEAYVVLECLRGSVETELLFAGTVEAPSPTIRMKQSVAFDAKTDGVEIQGDKTFFFDHTPAGSSNLAAFWCNNGRNDGVLTSTGTYDGAAGTELWDEGFESSSSHAAYAKAGIPSTTAEVRGVLAGAATVFDQYIGVITMTGVHQTVPVGTAAFQVGFGTSASDDAADAGADDLVVDDLFVMGAVTPTIGANQDIQNTKNTSAPSRFRQSTQLGSAGGVMSWTWTGASGWAHGAVAFKPAAAGAAASLIHGRQSFPHALLVR